MDRTQWLAARRNGIGSSDAAAIVGLSPYATALDVYCDKLGLLPDREESPVLRRGKRLEQYVADIYEEETGRRLIAPPSIIADDERPWMLASIDRLRDGDGKIVEIKTASGWTAKQFGPAGSDEFPEKFLIQIHHQLVVSGTDQAELAVLIGLDDFRIYPVDRNERLCERLIELEFEFWGRVQMKIPPEPDWSHARTPKLMSAMYPADPSKTVHLGDDGLVLIDEYETGGEGERNGKERREVAKAKLIHLMGGASVGILPDGREIRRREVRRDGHTVKPTTFFDFRIKQSKGVMAS